MKTKTTANKCEKDQTLKNPPDFFVVFLFILPKTATVVNESFAANTFGNDERNGRRHRKIMQNKNATDQRYCSEEGRQLGTYRAGLHFIKRSGKACALGYLLASFCWIAYVVVLRKVGS